MITPRRATGCTALALLLLTAACAKPAPPADPAYVAGIESWRADRLARLTADDGWLTLVGLEWLSPGANPFGGDSSQPVVLPGEGIPARVGVLDVGDDGAVTVTAEPGSGLELAGQPVTRATLATDADGKPDVLRIGRLAMYVIRRGDRFALRIKDPDAATRRAFKGIDNYPVDPAFKVTARLERYAEPRRVAVPTIVGIDEEMLAPGRLMFTIAGHELSLEPLISTPDDHELFLIFRDVTSGDTTYGAGRFLSAELEADGSAVLDFNRAYNPPCAFTPYATCPLPPEGNDLDVAITAGERYHGPKH
jgi:uncharacterized protein